MLIDNQEALKIWLTSHLEPLCDADPAALAKYVIALIKKDKAMSDLKDSMMQQLDVFLQSETQSFVDILFKAIDSKEYVTPSVETTTENAEEIPKPKEEKPEDEEDKKEEERTLPPDSTTPIREPSPRSKEEPKRKSGGHSPPPPDDRMPRRFGRSSPPPPLHGGNMADRLGPIRPRRHDNRPNRSPPRRFRSRSPSPRHDRFRPVRRRTRSPPRFRGRSFSRSPARHRPRGASLSPPTRTSRDSTPTKDEGAGGYTPSAKRPRCRDYDEKGFCLRGDLCKFDHGNDAVVLEDNAKPGVPGYQPGAPPAPGTEPYVPGLPHPAGINFPPPVNMSVPPPGYPPSYLGKRPHDGGGYVPPAKRFDFNRLGGRGRGRGRGRGGASSMLAVRNIPPELNTITHLNGHFVRYGTLVNVQVRFEGDPASALVTFQGPNEAELAFNTAEAVMNNRFIKVYWHMDKTKGTVKERLGNPNEDPLVLMHGDRVTKTLVNKKEGETSPPGEAGENGETQKEEKERAILAIQRNQEMLQTKADLVKAAEETRQKMVKQQEGLMNSKQDLLDGLIEQQKKLIVKIEKGKGTGTMKAEEKSAAMKLLKEMSNAIDRTREDIKKTLVASSNIRRSKQDIQKELLDAEMELFTKQQDGSEEAADIQLKVNKLRIEAAKKGMLPTSRGPARGRGAGRGARGFRGGYMARGGYRGGRGRGFTLSPGASTLDRRPTKILVSGYELDDKDELLAHFAKFGEIAETIEDEATPSVILRFKTRKVAEGAMLGGKMYGDRVLQLSWFSGATPGREEATPEEEEVHEEPEDDGYIPPADDYLPPGLQEHEDSLSQSGCQETEDNEAEESDGGDEKEVEKNCDDENENGDGDGDAEPEEELNEDLLLPDEEEEEEEERSWKRNMRSTDED